VRRLLGIVSTSAAAALTALLLAPHAARAQGEAAPAASTPVPPESVAADAASSPASILPEAPLEAPPPPPRRKGVVLESRLGALAFLGDFRKVAPTAPWWHVDAGYELLSWLAVFGYGELSFTDTSGVQGPSNSFAFPLYGFGGGARATVHATPRVAFFLEADGGVLRADVPKGALADLGYANAERFGLSVGGRLGVEWYQVDRHLAFGLDVGLRDATGFAQQFIGKAAPLMLDASGAIRYTF
jgi:hypothetical protein